MILQGGSFLDPCCDFDSLSTEILHKEIVSFTLRFAIVSMSPPRIESLLVTKGSVTRDLNQNDGLKATQQILRLRAEGSPNVRLTFSLNG